MTREIECNEGHSVVIRDGEFSQRLLGDGRSDGCDDCPKKPYSHEKCEGDYQPEHHTDTGSR